MHIFPLVHIEHIIVDDHDEKFSPSASVSVFSRQSTVVWDSEIK